MDRLGVSLAHLESKCTNFYDSAEVERVFYPEIEKLLLEFFPGATDALVYNHDVFDKDYTGDRTEDQEKKNPGVNAGYANLVHNDLNDNSGRVRCRELLTKNLRNFGAKCIAPRKKPTERCRAASCRSISPSRWRRSSNSRSCCAPGPPSPDQPYITNYRIYDDRVGRNHALHLQARPRVVLGPAAEAQRGLDAQMLRLGDRRLCLTVVLPYGVR